MEKATKSKAGQGKKDTSASKRKEYIDKLTKQLKNWDKELSEFEDKGSKKITDLQTALSRKLDQLKGKRNDLRKKVDSVESVSEDTFRSLKGDIEKMWSDVKNRFEGLRKELKK